MRLDDTKRCCTCHRDQPLDQFNVRRAAADGLQSRCRDCSREWYVRNRSEHLARVAVRNAAVRLSKLDRMAAHLADLVCVDCGEDDLRVLDFDHVRGTKAGNISNMLRDAQSWTRIQEELSKCDPRCANCHRRVTAERSGNYRQRAYLARAAPAASAAAERLARVLSS